jgi:hypothetical protein
VAGDCSLHQSQSCVLLPSYSHLPYQLRIVQRHHEDTVATAVSGVGIAKDHAGGFSDGEGEEDEHTAADHHEVVGEEKVRGETPEYDSAELVQAYKEIKDAVGMGEEGAAARGPPPRLPQRNTVRSILLFLALRDRDF